MELKQQYSPVYLPISLSTSLNKSRELHPVTLFPNIDHPADDRMSENNPSVREKDEDKTDYRTAEAEVSKAYDRALNEIAILRELVYLINVPSETPEKADRELRAWFEKLRQDIRRLKMKLEQSETYLAARERQFHYFAKRTRTRNRITRLRLYEREQKRHEEAVLAKYGQEKYKVAVQDFKTEKRTLMECAELAELWKQADKLEYKENNSSCSCDGSDCDDCSCASSSCDGSSYAGSCEKN